jgi:UDP-glucose 4-epimerase
MFDNILITGGAGRLGRHVCQRLGAHRQVTSLDRLIVSDDDRLGTTRQITGDITDYQALTQQFEGVDAICHLAAIPNPRTAPADVTFNTNVNGAFAVLQAAEDAGVKRVVVASSDSVFGLSYNPPDWPPKYLPVDEDHPVRPTEFYSLSKYVTETIAQSFAARGKLEVMVIRPVHIVFPPEYPELEARGADVENYHFWTFVAPEDVAQGFDLALDAGCQGYEVLTISGAEGLNQRPTLELARERWGDIEIRRPEVYEKNPYASVIDITRAQTRLGYKPEITWRDMIKDLS